MVKFESFNDEDFKSICGHLLDMGVKHRKLLNADTGCSPMRECCGCTKSSFLWITPVSLPVLCSSQAVGLGTGVDVGGGGPGGEQTILEARDGQIKGRGSCLLVMLRNIFEKIDRSEDGGMSSGG